MVSIVNPTRQVLAAGGISAGVGIRGVRGIEVAKVMKTAGYDFLFIDLEHGSMSIETACGISVAALDAGITPLVRVPHMDLQLATRCLDGGALGIVVPHVDTAEEARAIADALRFAPLGHRSIGGGFPQLGFAAVPVKDAIAALNEATLVVAMIETPRAVDNVDAIAAVPGIDVLLMGTNDLCLEMGIPGEQGHPRIAAAVDALVAACRRHGKTPALGGVLHRELLATYLPRGIRMVQTGNDLALLLTAAAAQVQVVRSCG